MFRWITVFAAIGLAASAAYGQSAHDPQPTPPLGHTRPAMGQPMMGDGMMGMMSAEMAPGMHADPRWGIMCRGMGRGEMGGGAMAHDMPGAGMVGSAASYLEARLAFARSELAIAPAQGVAWDAYAAALRAQGQQMPMHMDPSQHAMMMEGAFPDRLGMHISHLEARLGALKTIGELAVTLYSQLDVEQKHKADMLLPMSLCM